MTAGGRAAHVGDAVSQFDRRVQRLSQDEQWLATVGGVKQRLIGKSTEGGHLTGLVASSATKVTITGTVSPFLAVGILTPGAVELVDKGTDAAIKAMTGVGAENNAALLVEKLAPSVRSRTQQFLQCVANDPNIKTTADAEHAWAEMKQGLAFGNSPWLPLSLAKVFAKKALSRVSRGRFGSSGQRSFYFAMGATQSRAISKTLSRDGSWKPVFAKVSEIREQVVEETLSRMFGAEGRPPSSPGAEQTNTSTAHATDPHRGPPGQPSSAGSAQSATEAQAARAAGSFGAAGPAGAARDAASTGTARSASGGGSSEAGTIAAVRATVAGSVSSMQEAAQLVSAAALALAMARASLAAAAEGSNDQQAADALTAFANADASLGESTQGVAAAEQSAETWSAGL